MIRNYCIGFIGALTIATASAIEPGDEAPAFTLKSTKGEDVSLADHKGKLVVLEWINYDCPFVKRHYKSGNMPGLQEKYTSKDVVWLSINSSAEGKQGYLAAAKLGERSEKEGNEATAVLLDTSGSVGKSYGARTTPHMFVIGKDGKVAYAGGIDDKKRAKTSGADGATNYVAKALDALLAGKEVETPKAAPYGCGVKY